MPSIPTISVVVVVGGAGVLGSESESVNKEVWSALSSSVSILDVHMPVDVDVDDALGVALERSCVDCDGGADESSTPEERWGCEEDVCEEEEEEDARRSRRSR